MATKELIQTKTHGLNALIHYFKVDTYKQAYIKPSDTTLKNTLYLNICILPMQCLKHLFWRFPLAVFKTLLTLLSMPIYIYHLGYKSYFKKLANDFISIFTNLIIAPIGNLTFVAIFNWSVFRHNATLIGNRRKNLPPSLAHLSKNDFIIEATDTNIHLWHQDSILKKVAAGKITQLIKLDYDGTITSLASHCANLVGAGLTAIFNNELIEVPESEALQKVLRLAHRDDTLIVISSNNPFCYAIYNTLYKLFESDIDRDLILKRIAIISALPHVVLKADRHFPPQTSLLDPCSFTTNWRKYESTYFTKQRWNKTVPFEDFLKKLNLAPETSKIKLYTVDDNIDVIENDHKKYSQDLRFSYESIPERDLVRNNQFPENILALIETPQKIQNKTTRAATDVTQSRNTFHQDKAKKKLMTPTEMEKPIPKVA